MKSNYNGFRGFWKYIKDYKDNIENSQQYEDYIDEREDLKKQLNEAIFEKNIFETDLFEKETMLKNEKIDNNRNSLIIHKLNEEINCLEKKVDEKELLRRKTAGQVGGLKAKISVLKKDLARANQKINWLSNNQKAPTKEEIIAYETRMKEVEKRQKNETIQQ